MTSTTHTGVVVSAKQADTWHAEIKQIMADKEINFGDAVDVYIANAGNDAVDQSGWDAA